MKKKPQPSAMVEEMINNSVDPNKLIADAKISPKEKRLKKKRIFKVSTFHH